MSDILVPEQAFIRISTPSLSASLEFKQQVEIYEKIDQILVNEGVEKYFKETLILKEIESRSGDFDLSDRRKYQLKISQCLRTNIAKQMCNCSFREFSMRLSDSNTLQWFCKFDGPDTKIIPGKSTLNNIAHLIPNETIMKTVEFILSRFGKASTCLEEKVDLTSIYADSTCIKLDIHHPVDWVLLGDAVKSLIASIKTIRKHGLKHRINPPDNFLKKVNRLSIAMTMTKALRNIDSKSERKNLLRQLKSLLKIVAQHGMRYMKLLNSSWRKTDLSEIQAEKISSRILNILNKVDDITFQAHERIIGERQIKNKKKILSLHQAHAQVYKRGKAGADVEFGLQLFIAETEQGLIANWTLRNGVPQSDNKFIKPCIDRLIEADLKPDDFTGDRGFVSKAEANFLEKNEIKNYICPRNGNELKKKLSQVKFKHATNRRSQTEARIGIIKNKFIGNVIKAKGFNNQELHISWAILAHNLWVLSRLPMKEITEQKIA